MDGIEGHFSALFSRSPCSFSPRNGGSNLLVWVNMQRVATVFKNRSWKKDTERGFVY